MRIFAGTVQAWADLARMSVGLAMLAALVVSPGCPKRGQGEALPPCASEGGERLKGDPLSRCLRIGDAHFEGRARPGELDKAVTVYLDALSMAPSSVDVLSRVTRVYAVKGYGFPDDNSEAYRLAREHGLRCMKTAPDVLGAMNAGGGLLTPRAVSSAEAPLAPCMLWTSIAWARSLQGAGVAGASIDLRTLQLLARRVVALSPDLESGLPHAALGLALALPPAPLKPDLPQAEHQLRQAIKKAPWRLSSKVDLATLVFAPQGKEEAWREALQAVVNASAGAREIPENQRSIARAHEVLDAGFPDPAAWWR